jgi:hypothetical protein
VPPPRKAGITQPGRTFNVQRSTSNVQFQTQPAVIVIVIVLVLVLDL